MIIICDKCDKKFNIEDALIPIKGRLVKCGNCLNTWFYKIDVNENNTTTSNNNFKDKFIINENLKEDFSSKIENNNKFSKNTKIKKRDSFMSFLNSFFVILITFISIIILADTFKINIAVFLPGIIPLLESLYATLFDLQLFIKDLFN